MSNRQELRGSLVQKVSLGRAIAGARVARGLEQVELGQSLGRTQEWVSRVEAGDLVLSAFEYARIAEVLEIPDHVVRKIAWMGVPRR